MAGYDGRGARFDVIAVEGSDLSFTVTAVDSVAAAVDLSAATITGTIYNGAGAVVDTFTDAVSGAGSNIITFSLTDTEVDALTDPKSYAVVVTRGSDSRTWLAGSFVVSSADRARNGTSGTAVTATVDTNVSVTAAVLTSSGGSTDAADINIVDSAGYYTATNVEAALAEVKLIADTAAGGGVTLEQVQDDLGNTSLLAGTSLTKVYDDGAGTITLNVDAADFATAASISDHISDTADAHDASAISVADVATIYTATDVEAALAEVKVLADAAVTPAEAAAAYQPLAAVLTNTTASFTTTDETKLDGIETAADVTDTTNVTAAGALMDSEVTNLAAVKAFAAADYATAAQGATADTAIQPALADAKGDIFAATAANTVTRLAVGTNTHVLTADSAEATGVKWAAAAGGGGVGRFLMNYAAPGLTFDGGIGTQAWNGDWTYYTPFMLDESATLDSLIVHVATTGTATAMSLSVHLMGRGGVGGALIVDLGTVDVSSTGAKTISSIAEAIPAGRYVVTAIANGTLTPNHLLSGSPGAVVTTGSNSLVRLFGNTGTTYSATAPATAPNASNVVNGSNGYYSFAFMTWTV